MIPTTIGFEQRYCDDSGVEYGVVYHEKEESITLSCRADTLKIPLEKLEWFLSALEEVQQVIEERIDK